MARRKPAANEVVIVYNTPRAGVQRRGEHYAERRQVPAGQIFGFDLSTNEDMSRSEFQDALQRPLAAALEAKKLWRIGPRIVPATTNQPAARNGRLSSPRSATPCSVMVFRCKSCLTRI